MGNILQEIREKINPYLADQSTFISLILILVAIASFGLGRHSVKSNLDVGENDRSTALSDGISVEPTQTPNNNSESTPRFVASQNSDVYHLLHCSGAQRINEENKVFFDSKEEAETAGYRPAANCEGI